MTDEQKADLAVLAEAIVYRRQMGSPENNSVVRDKWNASADAFERIHDAISSRLADAVQPAAGEGGLREAMQEACDLLAERTYGSPVRSPGHNARLCLEAALSASVPAGVVARPLDDWHEDYGSVVWWCWQDDNWLGEPAHIGSPISSDWPGYHTHWTQHPKFPSAPAGAG